MPNDTPLKRVGSLPWQSPLHYAAAMSEDEDSWVLLYSGMTAEFTGRYSLLAFGLEKEVLSDNFRELERELSIHQEKYSNAWFGYLGYGLKNVLETLPSDAPSFIPMPSLWFGQYQVILVFDHSTQVVHVHAPSEDYLARIPAPVAPHAKKVAPLAWMGSNMTKARYLDNVATIKEAIFRGDLYQANLTRKFYGEFEETPHPFEIFLNLCEQSPAPYSVFMKRSNSFILSSSPEQFLKIDAEGRVETRPIKGSAPRFTDSEKDTASREALQKSEKNRAENLMIVDLMRNDLSRHCVPGTVKVDDLFHITSYATVHHMASTVYGQKMQETPALDVVKGCFPPGSMTGAPKIEAMQLCSELEPQARGVYSGAIGWFGGNGEMELSVVIRTLLIKDTHFEFQVGGAIVADSDPEDEWQETIIKSRGIAAALNIPVSRLEAL